MSNALANPKDEKTAEIVQEFSAALKGVEKERPTPADVKRFKEVVQQYPQMWAVLGDLAEKARDHIIRDSSLGEGTKASLQVGMKELRRHVSKPTDGALERLVIDQILLCWLRLNETELIYNAYHRQETVKFTESDYWEKRLTAAQTRYLRACESLARVRRLSKPRVHVNFEQRRAEPNMKLVDSAPH